MSTTPFIRQSGCVAAVICIGLVGVLTAEQPTEANRLPEASANWQELAAKHARIL